MYQIRVMLPSASCNLHCKYCINTNNLRGLSVDIDFEKLFAKMDLLTFQSIGIWGGEPLYNPNLEKVLRALRQHWPDKEIAITSNGVLLDRHFVYLFNSLDVSYAISHDGYAQHLRCKDFLKDPAYIELLKKLKRFHGFNAVINKYNVDLCKCYQYFVETCKDVPGSWDVTFELFELLQTESLDFMPSVSQIAELKKSYKEIQKLASSGAEHLSAYAMRKRHRKTRPKVWRCAAEGRLTIDTEGNIYQCQVAADRGEKGIPKPAIPLMCSECTHTDYCRGICPLVPDRLRKKMCIYHHLYFDALQEIYEEERR